MNNNALLLNNSNLDIIGSLSRYVPDRIYGGACHLATKEDSQA